MEGRESGGMEGGIEEERERERVGGESEERERERKREREKERERTETGRATARQEPVSSPRLSLRSTRP